ncbi:MAG: hypothetical protein A2945_00185 [Candidatus Liptonbacteria bacterium RIFCSPLOWO2_01_FULL_52_25]|uniref:Nudix hydrolase domain-containing protein n=1 Tax=Candidatus Liptonbacteria bacterium RIFCSPLOWO2_01_FULL_52_25 TaxID=1798650 RepID=A0A1G2CFX5_9BACT|nr:MAG: hypothetical protein A2945_00185 [Candidatus Liptonbacteria bacterium RIFCSPLOWO2_01_FULL_52_25]
MRGVGTRILDRTTYAKYNAPSASTEGENLAKHTVSGVMFDEKLEEVLLICEPSKIPGGTEEKLFWQLPGGKCCHTKEKSEGCCPESKEETLVRKYFEETGYRPIAYELVDSQLRKNRENKSRYVKYLFLVKKIEGFPLERQVSNQEGPQWFLLGALPRNLYSSHRDYIKMAEIYLLDSATRFYGKQH